MAINMNVGKIIKYEMTKRGLKSYEMAADLNVSAQTVRNFRECTDMRLSRIIEISDYFNLHYIGFIERAVKARD